jgi:hypothetical protein
MSESIRPTRRLETLDGEREVRRDGGFAHTALAGRDEAHVLGMPAAGAGTPARRAAAAARRLDLEPDRRRTLPRARSFSVASCWILRRPRRLGRSPAETNVASPTARSFTKPKRCPATAGETDGLEDFEDLFVGEFRGGGHGKVKLSLPICGWRLVICD